MQEFDEIFSAVLGELSVTVPKTTLDLWFRDTKLLSLTETEAQISVKTDFKRSHIEKTYTEQIAGIFEMLLGYRVKPIFVLEGGYEPVPTPVIYEPSDTSDAAFESTKVNQASPVPESEPSFFDSDVTPINASSGDYTFENFIVGSSNKFAHAACRSVAKTPAPAAFSGAGQSYNPLFIYGPSGLGKTHLLYSIINEIHKNYPSYKITYVKGDEFTNQMVESLGKGLNVQFREKFRKADVLLIDDIHFIAGKEGTQEEFFNTFNDLYEHKKQIILTSDRPPKDIQKLEERLRTRFEWGLLADIQPPDFELRVAIMAKKAEKLGKIISMEVLQFLAERLTNNVRQMEGAIKRIVAYSLLNDAEITVAMVNTCISDLLSNNGEIKVTPGKIVSVVAKKYNLSENLIYSKTKEAAVARARHICVYLMKKILNMSYPAIGECLNRHHSSIMHSYDWIEDELHKDTSFEIQMNELLKELKG